MNWYNYLACFFAGAFLANAVPHYVYGVCGDRFPTPFATPPGKGLSSSTTNVLWALLNMVIGYLLSCFGRVSIADSPVLVVFFSGIAAMSIMLSVNFTKKHAE